MTQNESVLLPVSRRSAHGPLPRREEVSASQFRRLMISNRQLFRADDSKLGERGLLDPAEQVRYVIDERRLFAVAERQATAQSPVAVPASGLA